MAKAKKTAGRKTSKGSAKSGGKAAAPRGAALAADVAALARQLAEITHTLRGQQAAIEELIALHHGLRAGPDGTVVPDETVGAIPRITPVPSRAA